ncbi:unnamed protein product, partial [Rotaria sp. Silwood2]
MSGNYTIETYSNIDTYGFLYSNTFDPGSISTNLLEESDDGPISINFLISINFQAVTQYIVVATTFYPNTTGSFSIVATGIASVIFSPMNSA